MKTLTKGLLGAAAIVGTITTTFLVTNEPTRKNTYDLPRRSTIGGAQKEVYITQQGTIVPGDTLELSGEYTWIKMLGVSGTADKHITLRVKANQNAKIGSTVYPGIEINGGYVDIIGDGRLFITHPDTTKPQDGIRLNSGHHNEVSGITFDNVKTGIIQNPEGGTEIEGQYFHHLTIKNMRNPSEKGRAEGFYLGKTSGTPTRFKDARIEDNVLDNLSGDGIQAGSGSYSIKRNKINKYGQANHEWQNSGIEIGGNASAVIEGNTVTNGTGTAIKIMGAGIVSVLSNKIEGNTTTRPTEDLIYIGAKGGKLYTSLQDNEFGNNTPARKWVYNNNDAAFDGGVHYKGNKGLVEGNLLKKGSDLFAAYVEPVVTPPTPPVVIKPAKKVTKIITVYEDGSVEVK